MSNEPLALGT